LIFAKYYAKITYFGLAQFIVFLVVTV